MRQPARPAAAVLMAGPDYQLRTFGSATEDSQAAGRAAAPPALQWHLQQIYAPQAWRLTQGSEEASTQRQGCASQSLHCLQGASAGVIPCFCSALPPACAGAGLCHRLWAGEAPGH